MNDYIYGKNEQSYIMMNNYIEQIIDSVMKILLATKEGIGSNDEFTVVFNLLMAKNKLSAVLNNITTSCEQ